MKAGGIFPGRKMRVEGKKFEKSLYGKVIRLSDCLLRRWEGMGGERLWVAVGGDIGRARGGREQGTLEKREICVEEGLEMSEV